LENALEIKIGNNCNLMWNRAFGSMQILIDSMVKCPIWNSKNSFSFNCVKDWIIRFSYVELYALTLTQECS
jgi:hypothetical protein